MENRVNKALENYKNGYNCAQAVACAFCDAVDMDEAMIYQCSEGFGVGMGGMQGACGAVSGAVVIAGLANRNGEEIDKTTKMKESIKNCV